MLLSCGSAIASGALGQAASLIESALAKALPVAIGFLASLIGVSGLARKVQNVVEGIRKRIDDAIEFVLKKAKQMAASLLRRLGIGRGEEGQEGQEGEESDTDQVVTEHFSMAGESHTLTITVTDNNVEAVMASMPRPIKQALNDQKQTEQDLINSTSGATQQEHIEILGKLNDIENWYDTELATIRGSSDKKQIGSKIKALAETLKHKIVALGNTYQLKNFVHQSLGITDLFSKIRGQVQELRKHYNPSTPKGQNDGHNNTAYAAEQLGWRAPWGQHQQRRDTAEPILTDAINQLDALKPRYGIDVSMEPDYQDGKDERDDCRKAASDPSGYLADKGLKVDTSGNLVPL